MIIGLTMSILQDRKIISHRGNLIGPNLLLENNPDYILSAVSMGFDVEVDVWYDDGYFLGHDSPAHDVGKDFFNNNMWIHCKNFGAVEAMKETSLNWFWHSEDKMTLTSHGHIWCYSGVYMNNGITVECGHPFNIATNVMGVCTDYPLEWRNYNG